MAQFPCLPLWTDAWLADTAHLTRTERGTYIDLLILMWRSPAARVPNDDRWLAKHMRMTSTEVADELRPLIKEFCQTDGNWITQKRLLREFVHRHEFSHRQSDRAKARWRKKKDPYRNNAGTQYHPKPSPSTDKPSSFGESQQPPHVDNSQPQTPDQPPQAAGDKKATQETKHPEDMTLTEINQQMGWRPAGTRPLSQPLPTEPNPPAEVSKPPNVPTWGPTPTSSPERDS